MTAKPPDRSRTLKIIFAIGLPNAIFYYPLDIYGWICLVVFAAFLTVYFAGGALFDKVAKRLGIKRKHRTEISNPARIARALFWIIVFFLMLNLGAQGFVIEKYSIDLARLVVQPFFYLLIMWSLSLPVFVLSVVTGLVFIIFTGRGKGARGFFMSVLWGFWLVVCISLLHFTVFKMGPGKSACAKIQQSPGVRLLLGRDTIDALPGLKGARPYDVMADVDRGLLFISLKQTSSRPGGIVRLNPATRKPERVLLTDLKNNWGISVNEFPERMAINPRRQELYALVLSPGNNHLLVASYAGRGLDMVSLLKLDAEPNNVYADLETSRVFVFYAGATRYGFAVYDPVKRRFIKEVTGPEFRGSAQHYIRDSVSGHLFLTNIGKNKIIEIDPKTLKIVKAKRQLNIYEGIASDNKNRLLFTPAPLTRKMDVLNMKNFQREASRPVGCGLADAVFDPPSRTVTVAGYTGVVDIFSADKTWDKQKRLRLGHLLRNITADGRGRVYACSGCGVFEITAKKLSEK